LSSEHQVRPLGPGVQQALSRASVALLFLAAFLVGLYRVRLGIDLQDEGMYLSAPLRYALGDVPFRDEFLNPHRMFDIVLWPLFHFFADVTVLQLRLLWLGFQTVAALALYRLFRRFAPDELSALACVSPLYHANLIWTPGYHVMGTFGFVLAYSLWLGGCLSSRLRGQLGLGLASGLVFFAAALSYLPLLALGAVPGLVLITQLRSWPRIGGRGIATAAHLGTLLLLGCTTLWVFAQYSLFGDWWVAQERVLATLQYRTSVWEKTQAFVVGIAPSLPLVVLAGTLTFGLIRYARARGEFKSLRASAAGTILPALIVPAILLPLIHWRYAVGASQTPFMPHDNSLVVLAIALGLHLGALFLVRTRAPDDPANRDWWFSYFAMTAGALLLALLHGYLSQMVFKASFAMLPLFVPGVVLLYRALAKASAEPLPFVLAGAVCLAVGFGSYTVRSDHIYGDARTHLLTEAFTQPRLVGIRSTPTRVAQLDGIADYLSVRVERGERLLVVGQAPLVYFLTQTRPALDHSWTAPTISAQSRRLSLQKMISAQLVPRYLVRVRNFDRSRLGEKVVERLYPLHAFAAKRYSFEVDFGPMEIWRRRD